MKYMLLCAAILLNGCFLDREYDHKFKVGDKVSVKGNTEVLVVSRTENDELHIVVTDKFGKTNWINEQILELAP